eukprot:6187572-Pleurochrysis_carterae.AAC.1
MLTTPLVGASTLEGFASGVTPDLRFERPCRASPTGLVLCLRRSASGQPGVICQVPALNSRRGPNLHVIRKALTPKALTLKADILKTGTLTTRHGGQSLRDSEEPMQDWRPYFQEAMVLIARAP